MTTFESKQMRDRIYEIMREYQKKHSIAPTADEVTQIYNRGRKQPKSRGSVQNQMRQLRVEGKLKKSGFKKARNYSVV